MLALGRGIAVRGDVQPAAVVVVSGCVPEGGAFLVATILVVGSLERMPEPDAPEAEPPAAPEAGGAIEIRKNNQVVTLTSGGPAVTVRGNRNTVTLLGACGSVSILGNRNTILLESATSVANRGQQQHRPAAIESMPRLRGRCVHLGHEQTWMDYRCRFPVRHERKVRNDKALCLGSSCRSLSTDSWQGLYRPRYANGINAMQPGVGTL